MGRLRHWLAPVFVALALARAAAGDPADRDDTESAVPCSPCELRVMSFNIEWGGTHVRFASVAEAIRAARADVAGIQEPEGNLERLARELGWHFSRRNHVVSKYPLVDPPGGDGRFVFVEVTPGRVVAIANVHLPSEPYGPYRLRAGSTAAEVTALERDVRLTEIAPLLDLLAPIHRRGVPVFLTGDFNSPSHEDWTEATAGRFPHRAAFPWPVSRAVGGAGFTDSWRAIHPDPVARPGFTWWAARPRIADYNPSDPGDQDRIDFVWFAGRATVRGSSLVGEPGARDVLMSVEPWPSDHRAVVSEFAVEPAPLPVLVTTDRRVYRAGEGELRVRWHAPEAPATIRVRRARDGTAARELRFPAEPAIGSAVVRRADLEPGLYEVALLTADARPISRYEFWLLDADARPSITVGEPSLVQGESIPLAWENGPGNRLDWIAIFDADDPPTSRRYRAYAYVAAQSAGTLGLSARTAREGWPLPPGRYVARLLEDDGFRTLAESAPFEIEPAR